MNNLPERLQQVDFSQNRPQREILRARLLTQASAQLTGLAKKEKWIMRFKSITLAVVFTAAMAGMILTFSWFILPFTKSPAAQENTTQDVNQIVTAMFEAQTQEAALALPSETPAPTAPDFLTYTNHEYGIAFDYPPSWSITETSVPQGTQLGERSLNRFDSNNEFSGMFLIEVKKGTDWILEIKARKYEKYECGGFTTSFFANFVPGENTFKPLEVLNKKAVRLRPEDGFAFITLGNTGKEPYPVPIVFPRLPGECEEWAGSDEEVFLFQWENNQMPLFIDIIYYSTYFTEDNLQNRTIDSEVLEEMDSIVESLRFQSVTETENVTQQPEHENESINPPQKEGYSVVLQANLQDETKTDIYIRNIKTGEEKFFITLENVYRDHYHPAEYVNDSLYVLHRISDIENWTDELWAYDSNGKGKFLYSEKGLTFRVSPNSNLIAIAFNPSGFGSGNKLHFLDSSGNVIKKFNAEELGNIGEYHQLMPLDWSSDGKLFWSVFHAGASAKNYIRVTVKDWQVASYNISNIDILDMMESDLNPNTGILAYSNHPPIFDAGTSEQFQNSGKTVTLFLYELYTRKTQAIASSTAKYFRPEWLSNDILEYNNPDNAGRLYYKIR